MALDVEKILQMTKEGFKPSEIAAKLNEGLGEDEDKITHQAVSKVIRDNALKDETKQPAALVLPPQGIQTMTAEEYGKYSEKHGRTRYGGEKGVKVNATIEMLRAYLNSGWKPSMLMEMWQLSEEEFKQLVWRLAKAELRDREPTINFKQDFIRF